MLLAGMLAMVMTATAPAIAQVLENANQSDSGTVTIGNDVSSGSDNGQTDQVQATDQPEVVAPPPPPPKMEMKKEEKQQQEPAPAPQKAASPPPPPAEAKTGTPEAKAAPPPPKMEEKKALPKTGGSGSASLLTLGAGALLVGGGLLARKIAR